MIYPVDSAIQRLKNQGKAFLLRFNRLQGTPRWSRLLLPFSVAKYISFLHEERETRYVNLTVPGVVKRLDFEVVYIE